MAYVILLPLIPSQHRHTCMELHTDTCFFLCTLLFSGALSFFILKYKGPLARKLCRLQYKLVHSTSIDGKGKGVIKKEGTNWSIYNIDVSQWVSLATYVTYYVIGCFFFLMCILPLVSSYCSECTLNVVLNSFSALWFFSLHHLPKKCFFIHPFDVLFNSFCVLTQNVWSFKYHCLQIKTLLPNCSAFLIK